MLPHRRRVPRLDRITPLIFVGLLVVLVFAGGASAPDEVHQVVARLAAIVALALATLAFRRTHWVKVREVLLFLLLALTVIAVQLIPLPPGLWSALPGRDVFTSGFELAGLEPVWRPLSLTPDRTLNSLLALLPAFAATLCMAVLPPGNERMVLLVLIGATLVAVAFGIVQVATGRFYFYRVTNTGWAVGLFANRSHQAVLLAVAFPLLAAWASPLTEDRSADQVRGAVAACLAALFAAMVLATGSRAGLVWGQVGMIAGFLIFIRARQSLTRGWRGKLIFLIPIAIVLLAVVATLLSSRDVAVARLFSENFGDQRAGLLPIYGQMAWDFFPFGSGMGSFDPVFRLYEPYEHLHPQYLNHAHNDLVQVVIEAGLLGGLLILLFLGWFVVRAWRLWRVRGRAERDSVVLRGRAGSAMILVMLGSSAVEYPLRTPLLSFIFVVAAIWMMGASPAPGAGKGQLASKQRSDTGGAGELGLKE